MNKYIPYAKHHITEEDIDAVIDILRSDYITQGPLIERFETAIKNYCDADHAVAVCNATAALHISCLALGLKVGDYLWTSPNTFVASANCGLYCGAKVDFVDIDPMTYNISVQALEKKLQQAEKQGTLPKILVVIHFAGHPADLQSIKALSDKYHFHIIEDAAHAIGSSYQQKKTGSCEFSDLTIFSFHPAKIITTGEGGMILTNQTRLAEQLKLFRSHGITRDAEIAANKGAWHYQQLVLGFNYRMTDIQAALGLSQFQSIDQFLQRRQAIAARYDQALANLPIQLPKIVGRIESAWHLYVIRLQTEILKYSRKQVFDELREAQIGVQIHYIPVHTQFYYHQIGFREGDFPEAEHYYQQAISLPIYATLTDDQQNYVIDTLRNIIDWKLQ